MSLHFAVFYGSVRSERQGIEYARFLNAQLAAGGHQVSFVDPLEYRLPLLDKMHKEYPAGAGSRSAAGTGRHYPLGRWVHDRQRRVQSQHPTGADEPAGSFPRGMVLAAVGDRLLLGRGIRRCSGGDAAARYPRRARHAEHSFDLSDAEGTGPVRSGRKGRAIRRTCVGSAASSTNSNGTPTR